MGPEAGGTAHLQSQGEGEAANPHRPVPQGFESWTFGSKVQYPTPELPAPQFRQCLWYNASLGANRYYIARLQGRHHEALFGGRIHGHRSPPTPKI